MRIYLLFENLSEKLLNYMWYWFICIHEIKNIIKKRKLYKKVILTEKQKKEIDQLWIKNYGRKIPYYWHRLYQSYTGNFDPYYFPEYIYTLKVEPKCSKRHNRRSFGDKNLLDILFENNSTKVKTPRSYIKCISGCYYYSNREIISFNNVIDIIWNIGEVIAKKTINSSSGRGVYLFNFIEGIDAFTGKTVREILSMLGKDYVIQEKLKPHESYKAIYPHSINTIRVVTYILDDGVYCAPLIMRIGQGGSYLDNTHAGGMFIGIDDNGMLEEEAYTEYQKRFTEHPDTNFKFEGHKAFGVEKIICVAKSLHLYLPKFHLISWDFMIDENGDTVLIEVNLQSQTIWVQQMANGKSFFGLNTEKMIQYARKE